MLSDATLAYAEDLTTALLDRRFLRELQSALYGGFLCLMASGLLRALAGAHRPAGGRIRFDGSDITRVPAHKRVGMGIVLMRHSLKAHHPGAILACALLAGLLVEALFDHYLWTAAAGRILLGLVLGLWASRISGDAEAQK